MILVALAGAIVVMTGSSDDEPEIIQVFGYDDAYTESIVEIQPGESIEWFMVGDNPHNVFASDGSWASELVMDRGSRFTRTFSEPGVYPYFCTFHARSGVLGL